jgi:hypothetical protein
LTSLKSSTMNRAIMLCSSMIIAFFSVVVAMSIMACAWIHTIKSMNFNLFCSFFVVLEPCLLKLELPTLIGGSKLFSSLWWSKSIDAYCSFGIDHFKILVFFVSSLKFAHLGTFFKISRQCMKTKLTFLGCFVLNNSNALCKTSLIEVLDHKVISLFHIA